MKYVNPETRVRIELSGLTNEQKSFYPQALKKFRENTSWPAFDEFAFGMMSPIYSGCDSHLKSLR